MSYYNETKNPIPFYPLEGDVWTNYKPLWSVNECKYQYQKYPLFPGKRYFQLRVSDNMTSQTANLQVKLRNAADNAVVNIAITRTLFVHQSLKRSFVTIEIDIPSGFIDEKYYLGVETDYGNFYSEPFCVVNPNDHIGIVWSSSKGRVGDLIYPSGFRNYINVDAEVIPLEPEIEEETIENGFGEETPTLQILRQGYRFSFMAPNHLAQALSALRLHDRIQIINRKKYDYDEDFDEDIKDVQCKVTPEEDGCFSFVEISFVEETVLSTSCIDEIIPANNPPQADIVWDSTKTTEDRQCIPGTSCQTTIFITEYTFDPDDNLDYLEWERSENNGITWQSLGNASGDTYTLQENDEGEFWYRLKAVDTYNAIGYSNILKYLVNNSPSFTNVVTSSNSNDNLYIIKRFEIVGNLSQTVKMNLKVLNTYGRGFTLKIYNRDNNNELFSWTGGPSGTETDIFLNLDGAGIGRFVANLLLNPCNGTDRVSADIEFTMYQNDNVDISQSKMNVSKSVSCSNNINIDLPPGWLP